MNSSIKFRDIVEFLFLPLLTAAVFLMWQLNQSVSTLNVQVGVLIEKSLVSEKRIDRLEQEIFKK